MTIKIREYVMGVTHIEGCNKRRCSPACVRVTNGWEADIRTRLPNGKMFRERVRVPVSGKASAFKWAQDREAHLIREGRKQKEVARKQIPLFEEFFVRFIEEYAVANQHKPGSIYLKKSVGSFHFLPRFGKKRLDEVTNTDIQKFKANLADHTPSTVNNILAVLSTIFKVAVKWGVIDQQPTIEKLKSAPGEVDFFEPEEYEQLVEAAAKMDHQVKVAALLGGEAGLRCGEMVALEQRDIDHQRGLININRSEWLGHVTVPKGGKGRQIHMTKRLAEALLANVHDRGPRVLCNRIGEKPMRARTIANWMVAAQRKAGLSKPRPVHILRHTFCSRLATLGAPAKAIQKLAGHHSIRTTERYMHLSPAAKEGAIRLLEQPEDKKPENKPPEKQ